MKNVNELIAADTARRLFDVNGKGLSVVVLGTGLNTDHVDFQGRIIARRNFTADNGGAKDNVQDGNGHATNVTGIIAANGDHVGMAPGANIIPLKVLPDSGGGSFEVVRQGLQWALKNRDRFAISVVCLGLGDGSNRTGDSDLSNDIFGQLIRDLSRKRVAVVVPSGNDFTSHQSQQGMGYPAIIRQCVSVGSVYAAAEGSFTYASGAAAHSTRPGQITPFAQRLHPSKNPDTYTDIFAPGAPSLSSGINGPHGESTQHGTTQAAAVVSGLILLMQELHQRVTGELPAVDAIVRWLRQGSVAIYDGDDEDDNTEHTHLTYPLVDAFAALYQVRRALQPQLQHR